MSRLYCLSILSVLISATMAFSAQTPLQTVSLDGTDWLIAKDPNNVGKAEGWFNAVPTDVKPIRVPGNLEEAFYEYDGVVWYYKNFEVPANPHRDTKQDGRSLFRFWAVDFKADVWLNGKYLGTHEGSEAPFTLDATDAVKPGEINLLAVRVLNPTNGENPPDGIRFATTPHGPRNTPFQPGLIGCFGGIVDSVEFVNVPAARISNVFVKADPKTGEICVETSLLNVEKNSLAGELEITVAPTQGGSTIHATQKSLELASGENKDVTTLKVENHQLWDLKTPYLYRVTIKLKTKEHPDSFDEQSVKTGFREFVFRDGYFRLNGHRIFLKCAHTGSTVPVGFRSPYGQDRDFFRRDLINGKMMGFNTIRFIASVPVRHQLDLADELGLLVYEECYAAWTTMEDSPRFEEWFNDSIRGMILRDRNHPSVIMWGLLNECTSEKVNDHASDLLPLVQKWDGTRVVLYHSGRFDRMNEGGPLYSFPKGITFHSRLQPLHPHVSKNDSGKVIKENGVVWKPGRIVMHPDADGEYAVIRWQAPCDATYRVAATFEDSTEGEATTDVHVLHNGKSLFKGFLNLNGGDEQAKYEEKIVVKKGDILDFAVGRGNGDYGGDSTAADIVIQSDAQTFDATKDFSDKPTSKGVWSYGLFTSKDQPDADTYVCFEQHQKLKHKGTFANPGQNVWEDTLDDHHPYFRAPHSADIINFFRKVGEISYHRIFTSSGGGKPYFPSEYGIGSGVNWTRLLRMYQQRGDIKTCESDFYQKQLDRFMNDYRQWKMDEIFALPEMFFKASIVQMAGQRALGLNALRSNPSIPGYSMTALLDQGISGEGLWTTFRELKPGTTDAIFDGFAPLRWCTFVEPVNSYTDVPVTLDVVLANEDVLGPGTYPARAWVFGPNNEKVYEKAFTVTVPETEGPFAIPAFKEQVQIKGPTGEYRLVVAFEKNAAAAGGETTFYRFDRADMPKVTNEVVLWGSDPKIETWLKDNDVKTVKFDPSVAKTMPQRILALGIPANVDPDAAFADLVERIKNGSEVVFLSEQIFRKGDDPIGYLPLEQRGHIGTPMEWLYHLDQWAKHHPVFAGLQAGGLMDYGYYREIIPSKVFVNIQTPTEAISGANNASLVYESGLMVATYQLGKGRFLINTLLIRENLGTVPQAERLLRNLLNLPMHSDVK